MLTVAEIQGCNRRLRAYDVDQRGWEQEPNGFTANTSHILTHMVMTLASKDFTDPVVVRTDIAPDSVMHALRLLRWANLGPLDAIHETTLIGEANNLAKRFGRVGLSTALFIEANGILATHIQDLGHQSTRERAVDNTKTAISKVSGRLINSAQRQAKSHGFNLVEAFDARLVQLRERFGIPEPGAETNLDKPDPVLQELLDRYDD